MNNSSAYNNVLLKPAVQTQAPQAQAPVTRRNQDDSSYASFKQSFKDANDQVRSQDDKAKPAAKKTAQVDNRKPAADVEKKPSVPAKQTSGPAKQTNETSTREPVADAETKSESKECASQNGNSTDLGNQESDSKSAAKKSTTEDEVPADALAAELINPLAPAPVVVPATETAASDVILGVAEPVTQVAQGSSANSVATESIEATAEALTNITSDNQVDVDQQNLNVDGKPVKSEQGISGQETTDVLNQQAPVDPLLQQTADALVVTPDEAVEQASAILTSGGSAALPKTAVNPSTGSVIAEDTSDSETLSAITAATNSITAEGTKNTAENMVKAAPVATAEVDADQAQQMLDTKSSFEKVMQNLVRPESGSRDDSAALANATQTAPNNTNSSTNALDSMLRFNDAHTPAARSFVVQAAIPIPVGQPQWSQAVGEKVLWLAAQNVSSAEIHMSPENLGPVQVKVSVNQEQATVNFTSHHPAVREALDQSLGRLRDMFSEQGLNLVNVDVSDKSFSRQQGDAQQQKAQTGNNEVAADEEVQVFASAIVQKRLVDHYA